MQFNLLKVLVVDDNHHMRIILTEVLRAIGVRDIWEATDGSEALKQLKAHPIDVVLADLAMAPMDGIEMLRQLRNGLDSPGQMIPVVMITGHSTERRVREARDAGANEFLAKPVTARGVLDRIVEVIEHPRSYVRTDGYFGPDRRRHVDTSYIGPRRRADDPPEVLADESPQA